MNAPTQSLLGTQRCLVTVKLFANDGTEDTTSILSVQISNGSYMTVTQDPTDPTGRKFICKALNTAAVPGLLNVTFNRQGTTVADPLVVPFQLGAAPNLSRVEFVSCDPLPPG